MSAGSLALELMLLIAVGIFVRKTHIVGEGFSRQLASPLTKIILPCMIVNSMQGSASLEELRNCGLALLLSLLTIAIQFTLGQLVYLWKKKTSSARIFRFGFLFTNFTFIGIPVVESLYGPKGILYFVVYLVPLRLVYYSCARCYSPHRDRSSPSNPSGLVCAHFFPRRWWPPAWGYCCTSPAGSSPRFWVAVLPR